MRTAKIALSADVKDFKKKIEEAKSSIQSLGQSNVDPQVGKKIQKAFVGNLNEGISVLEKKIKSISKTLEMSTKVKGPMDSDKIVEQSNRLQEMKKRLSEIKKVKEDIAKGKVDVAGKTTGVQAPEGAMGGTFGKFASIGKALAMVGLGMGFMSLFGKREGMATERLKIRGLTRGGGYGSEASQFGYTPTETRQQSAMMAQAAGGGVTGEDLNRFEKDNRGRRKQAGLVGMAQQIERAYGVGIEQTAALTESARKAGVKPGSDQEKFLSNAIGAAVATGLEGSQIGEYLASMTQYLSSMSEGVDIDTSSLNGFAAAMGNLPFFKADPTRIFSSLRSMDKSFTSGDMFQQAQASRAILKAAPGAGPAATEFRKGMGLFGKLDKGTLGNLKQAGVDTRALEVGGSTIVKNIFDEIMKNTEKMSPTDRMYEFGQRTGLGMGAATASIFGDLATGKGTTQGLEKKLQEAQMSPEERLNQTYKNADGSIKDLSAKIEELKEVMATNIGDGMTTLGQSIVNLTNAINGLLGTGQSAAETGGDIASGAMVAGTGAMAAKGIGKFMGMKGTSTAAGAMKEGGGRVMKAFSSGGVKGATKAISRAASAAKVVPLIGNLMSVGFALKDAYDIGNKLADGEKVNWEDWGQLGLSAAAIFDPTRLTAIGSVGLGAYQAFGGSESQSSTPSAGMTSPSVPMMNGPQATDAEIIPFAPRDSRGSMAQTSQSSLMPNMDFSPMIGNQVATSENTNAIKELTMALRNGKGNQNINPRVPQYNTNRTAVGKTK